MTAVLSSLQADLEILTASERRDVQRDPFLLIDRGKLKVRSKAGKLVKFVPNSVQQRVLAEVRKCWERKSSRHVRLLIVKSRQQGLSTISTAILFCLAVTQPSLNFLICADSWTNSQHLFDMVGRYEHCVDQHVTVTPELTSDNQRKMTWDHPGGDTSILVDQSRNKSLGITKTFQHVLLSELSRFARGEEIMGALIPAIPTLPGEFTIAILESTAKGAGGIFYREVQACTHGEGPFKLMFFPWFATEEYTLPVPLDFKRTQEEEEFAARYENDPWGPITDGQLLWRRQKIAEYMAIHDDPDVAMGLFLENFPSNLKEAFIVSGDLVLAGCGSIVEERIENIPAGFGTRGFLQLAGRNRIIFQPEDKGIVRVYQQPIRGEEYVIGADIGDGLASGAWSTASVRSLRSRDQVATVRCKYPPDVFEDVLYALGLYYNYALLAPECNNMGAGVVSGLHKGRQHRQPYDNLFRTQLLASLTFQRTKRIGWNTTTATLPQMENDYADFIRQEVNHIRDKVTLDEVLTYVRDPESGDHKPLPGCFSDALIADMIAVQMLATSPTHLSGDQEEDVDGYGGGRRQEKQTFVGSGY